MYARVHCKSTLTGDSFGRNFVHLTTSRYHSHRQLIDDHDAPFYSLVGTFFHAFLFDDLVHDFCRKRRTNQLKNVNRTKRRVQNSTRSCAIKDTFLLCPTTAFSAMFDSEFKQRKIPFSNEPARFGKRQTQ